MKQIEEDTVCFYCYGCNRLEREDFNGIRRCNDFVEAMPMGSRYIKAVRSKEEDKKICQ